jgi:SAM-dependent methyltransferase
MVNVTTQYLSPVFNLGTIDRYYARKSIVDAITANKHLLKGKLLDVGCGVMPYKSILLSPAGSAESYIGLDFEKPVTEGYAGARPDLYWNGTKIPMNDNSVNAVLLTEVLEHCFDPAMVVQECSRVLKEKGHILITVPFVWPLHDIPYDAYRYTPFSLERILSEAGFKNINIKALGGWNASLGQMMGLWLNRSGIGGWRRKFLYSFLFRPFIKWLYKTDRKPENFYDNSHMYTGLTVTAQKIDA